MPLALSSSVDDDIDALDRRWASLARALTIASSMEGLDDVDCSNFSDGCSPPDAGRTFAMMDAILPWREGMDHQGGDDDDDDDDDDRRRVTNNAPATDAPDARFATVMALTIMSPSSGEIWGEGSDLGGGSPIWGGCPPGTVKRKKNKHKTNFRSFLFSPPRPSIASLPIEVRENKYNASSHAE